MQIIFSTKCQEVKFNVWEFLYNPCTNPFGNLPLVDFSCTQLESRFIQLSWYQWYSDSDIHLPAYLCRYLRLIKEFRTSHRSGKFKYARRVSATVDVIVVVVVVSPNEIKADGERKKEREKERHICRFF